MPLARTLRLAALALACAAPLCAQDNFGDPPFARVAFFPPTPPVYGAPLAEPAGRRPFWFAQRSLTPPDGLAAFLAEPLYPALSTRLFNLKLDPKLEARLHAYRTARDRETTVLLNHLLAPDAASDAIDEPALRTLAAAQTPRLVALEAEAERLRGELLSDYFWRANIDWNAGRRWKLDPRQGHTDAAGAEAQFQVVRAAAHYQAGLLPAQRGLLRELAIELQAAARKARGQPASRADSDAMFFSPETARFRLPAGASPAVRAQLAAFNGRKAALKRELHDTVIAQDRTGAAERAAACAALADRQWPEIVALEQLAEEIRRELAARLAPTPPPAPPWVPAKLFDEINAYNADREVFYTELKILSEDAAGQIASPYVAGEDAEAAARDLAARRNEARRAAMRDYMQRNAGRFAKLEARYQAIRASLAAVAAGQIDRKTGQPLSADTLLRTHSAALAEFDTFGRESVIYTHYRLAMLQPGLSPEPRRLLFGYAQMGLAQPLPFGEFMPRSSAKRPVAVP
jgi:hypothetical protein